MSANLSWVEYPSYAFGQITFENGVVYLEGTKNFRQDDNHVAATITYNGAIIGNVISIVQPYNKVPTISIDRAGVNHAGGAFPVFYTKDCGWGDLEISTDSSSLVTWTIRNDNEIDVSCAPSAAGTTAKLTIWCYRSDGEKWQGTVDITWS